MFLRILKSPKMTAELGAESQLSDPGLKSSINEGKLP